MTKIISMKLNNKRAAASIQLVILIASLFAFAFIIGGADVVSAEDKPTTPGTTDGQTSPERAWVWRAETNTWNELGASGTEKAAEAVTTGTQVLTSAQSLLGKKSPAEKTTSTAKDELETATDDYKDASGEGSSGTSSLGGLAGLLGAEGIFGGLINAFSYAALAYGIGQMLGGAFGLDDNNTNALSSALGLGVFAGQMASTLGASAGLSFGIGAVVALAVFLLMYKNYEIVIVQFDCMPWQAPTGGNSCEVCNDPDLPCSEYRCRSLGQNCELVNSGTEEEKCVNVNPYDVDPPIITPNLQALTSGHRYADVKNSPPGPGFKIVNMNSSDGCLKAFTPLKFGVDTNEPALCKIDYNHTLGMDDMSSYMGGTNMYLYNHTEVFSLPGAKAFENSSFILENGGYLNFFIRCQDKNGNENSAEYNVRFCMDPTPDTTAPKIKATSILNGGCVAENTDSAIVEFYTDEPASCSWSHTDQSYENMYETMNCSMNLYKLNAEQLYTCKANLTGIARDNTDFYVRCKDQPGMPDNDRNKNEQSFKFSLHGSTALKMNNLQPNGTIFGAVSPAPVELYAETLFGCDEGKSICFYSKTGNLNDYLMFFDTNKDDGVHTQRQDVVAGNQKYYVKCVDSGGNVAEDNITFNIEIDTTAPVIARVYEENSMLKIVTIRDSQCSYTMDDCDFTFEEGTEMPYANSTTHVAEWKNDETYYIKCRDEFRNENADCSIVVRPGQNFL
ncbi:MAG: hypothetical protein NUV37_00015 [Nanoarchaeota archaeon]|nr:hypothetical protein [Nanoarchaeota archaeon]